MATEGEAEKMDPQAMTAGQRLAAAKAAKAARKASKRGNVQPAAEVGRLAARIARAGEWTAAQRKVLWLVIVALVVVVSTLTGWRMHVGQRDREATEALGKAFAALNAPVLDEQEAAELALESEELVFPSLSARAEDTLEKARVVVGSYGSSEAAHWARLAEGRALLELDRAADARKAYQAAANASDVDDYVRWRALEGVGFSHEAEGHPDEAIGVFEQLGNVAEGRYRPVADYHVARIDAAQGRSEKAKERLGALLASLAERAADEEGSAPEFSFVQEQAETLLIALGGSPEGVSGAGAGQLTPELIQQLTEQMKSQPSPSPNEAK